MKEWHPAQVPGVVQTDLLRDGLIPDPFYQDNDTRLPWIGLTELGIPHDVRRRCRNTRARPRGSGF